MRSLLVLLPPFFRGLFLFHALLNLRVRDRHYAPQEIREVLVFRAIGLLAHGAIIAQSPKGWL